MEIKKMLIILLFLFCVMISSITVTFAVDSNSEIINKGIRESKNYFSTNIADIEVVNKNTIPSEGYGSGSNSYNFNIKKDKQKYYKLNHVTLNFSKNIKKNYRCNNKASFSVKGPSNKVYTTNFTLYYTTNSDLKKENNNPNTDNYYKSLITFKGKTATVKNLIKGIYKREGMGTSIPYYNKFQITTKNNKKIKSIKAGFTYTVSGDIKTMKTVTYKGNAKSKITLKIPEKYNIGYDLRALKITYY